MTDKCPKCNRDMDHGQKHILGGVLNRYVCKGCDYTTEDEWTPYKHDKVHRDIGSGRPAKTLRNKYKNR